MPKSNLEKGSVSFNTLMNNSILRQIVLGAALTSGWAVLCAQPLPAAEDAQADPWYARNVIGSGYDENDVRMHRVLVRASQGRMGLVFRR